MRGIKVEGSAEGTMTDPRILIAPDVAAFIGRGEHTESG